MSDAYLVLRKLAKNIGATISFVSMAGTTSKIDRFIAPKLEASNLFKVVFGKGYHLSLVAYPAIYCFNMSFRTQVVNVTSCVIDLFNLLGKTHLLPEIFANEYLCMIHDILTLSDAGVSELEWAIRKKMGEKEYQRQKELGIGISERSGVLMSTSARNRNMLALAVHLMHSESCGLRRAAQHKDAKLLKIQTALLVKRRLHMLNIFRYLKPLSDR